MITLNEFIHLYRLKESKEFGYYELVPWDRRSRLIVKLPSSFCYRKSRYFFVSGDGWETHFNDFWGDEHPKLESRFEERVQEAIKYVGTIEDFDKLVDPQTLTRHCLGSDPSHYVLRAIRREEKKNEKNELLSCIGQRRPRVVEKEKYKEAADKGSSTPALNEGRVASPGVSIKEVTPLAKKRKTRGKGKEKVGTSVWADARMALARANEVLTPRS
ncbi:hypothetical protein SO802_004887 [Lithocarpus litseifolius]|uniref:Uncharacterized protein n=1 Tax=Lithocarpus litseifolius TaxID=425828 RepID=A0AAW2DHV6_9ROSI